MSASISGTGVLHDEPVRGGVAPGASGRRAPAAGGLAADLAHPFRREQRHHAAAADDPRQPPPAVCPSRASRSYSLTRPMTAPSASTTGTPLIRLSRSRPAITGTGVSGVTATTRVVMISLTFMAGSG